MALHLIPSSSSNTPQFKYDVFLSFRGEDTRQNFTSHLHQALRDKQIEIFIDYKLNRGDAISPSLLEAIEESLISVVIFSKNYASSKWCLEELVKILQCRQRNKQMVIPVFYGVDPSDVRHQTGSFAEAFAEHEQRYKETLHKVQRWKDALKEATNLSGFDSRVLKPESVLIKDIVEDILKRLNHMSPSDDNDLVGIASRIEQIASLLCIGTEDVRSLGIWGIGGIGKTTLAEAVFNRISCQFEDSYFIRNVREQSEQSGGLNQLRQDLHSAILGDRNMNICTSIVGCTFTRNRLGRKKLLIVFDDVSNFGQIEDLMGGLNCLSSQSRIIITTRDKQVLRNCGVDQVYEVEELFHHEALELFCRYAFKGNHPTEDYLELSERAARYAGGIPLALKVLGSNLLGKRKEIWKSAIDKLRTISEQNIHKVLKISYDGLDDEVRGIFLDIACFFKGCDIEVVKAFLNACGFHTETGIDILIDMSMIAISSHNKITMHDLLQAMAMEIVRQQSVTDPGKRSRLWNHKDIYGVLTKNTGTETIQGISLDMSEIEDIHLNQNAFTNMRNLRFLKFYTSSYRNKVHVSQGLEADFSELRYLKWYGCPLESLPSSIHLDNLVKLDMSYSKVKQLWSGVQELVNLKEIDLSYSSLTICPNLSGSPNLQKLSLCCCSNLEMMGELPPNIQLLNLIATAIEELPSSIKDLSRLHLLDLDFCERLKSLPNSICKWKSLKTLNLEGCSELDKLPEDIGSLESLNSLKVEKTGIRELPSSIIYLNNLEWLHFKCEIEDKVRWSLPCMKDWKKLTLLEISDSGIIELPDNLGCLSSLTHLHLAGNSFESIPASIIHLSKLECLNISNCERLKCLPKLHLVEVRLDAYNCTSLEDIVSMNWERMDADFGNCIKLDPNIFEDSLKDAILRKKQCDGWPCAELCYPGSEIPEWFSFRSRGSFINVELTPNWFDHSFMGFTLCFVVAPCPDHQEHLRKWRISWNCNLNSKDGHMHVLSRSFLIYNDGCHERRRYIKSNHVFMMVYFEMSPFELLCYENVISFQFYIHDGIKHHKIEKCGVHLMFAQRLEEFDGSSHISEDEKDVLSLSNVHSNCEEEEDEPHPKRLKFIKFL